ncbi:MAG: hypothetical protein AAF907_07035 [Planctomycetota bacterium]
MRRITLGFAHFDDYSGAYFTAQHARLQELPADCELELVFIDSSPETEHGRGLRKLASDIESVCPVVYEAFEGSAGTSAPRERVIERAAGEVVVVVDCHTYFAPGGLRSLIEEGRLLNPGCGDIVSGPLLYDDQRHHSTHFAPVWRSDMFGIWADAWLPPSGDRTDPGRTCYSVHEGPDGRAEFLDLTAGINADPFVGFPEIPYAGHQAALRDAGWELQGEAGPDGDAAPFETPGQGLGTFAIRKAQWPGFPPGLRGFGGEELMLHERVRRTGGRAICVPAARWGHRFVRPGGAPYPLRTWDRIRNYVLWAQALGLDVEFIRTYFVKEARRIDESQWEALLRDPLGMVDPGPASPAPGH